MKAPSGSWRALAGACGLLGWALGCTAAPIYSCIDASGKKLTSDRPIAECRDRDQETRGPSGAVTGKVPPTPTADEIAAEEARKRAEQVERERVREAFRRDRNLLARFPSEAAHNKARESALEDSRQSVKRSEQRVALLIKERKPLLEDAEFYVGKPLPTRLKQQLDANDASKRAQEDLMLSSQDEIKRINALFDAELVRLRALWSGVQPGSMGLLPVQPAASGPRKGPVSRASASESR